MRIHHGWCQRVCVGFFITATVACDAQVPTAGVPPATPTHHAVLTGTVVNTRGEPLADIMVGPRFSTRSSVEYQVSVEGGGRTDTTGNFRIDVYSTAPRRADGVAEVYIHALKYGPPSLVTDSVLVRIRLAPRAEQAPVTTVGQIKLPLP